MTVGGRTRRKRRSRKVREQDSRRIKDAPAKETAEKRPPEGRRPDEPGPRAWRLNAAAFAALGLLVAASYLPAAGGGFVWDDTIVTTLDSIRRWDGLLELWFSPGSAYFEERVLEAHYWPIVYSTFWLEHKLWGLSPAGYHVVNILLHFANTALLWRLLSRLAVPGAWFAAALFAAHPLHTESVAWVIARKDLLSGMFYLLAFWMWIRFLESPCRRRYAAALALFAAGLLCKTVVVTLPAALLILQWWRRGRVTRGDLLRVLPFFAVGFAFAVADTLYYRDIESLSLGYSMAERGLIAARALCFYAGKLAWPADLMVIYPHWDASAGSPVAWACAAAVAGALGAAWFLRRRAGRGPLACLLFFAVTLSPVLGFIDYGYMQFSFVADRYQYLAGIGLIALFAAAGARGVEKLPGAAARAARGAAVILLVILGALTWNQSEIYRDDITFYSHVVSFNPSARAMQANLAVAFHRNDQFEEAEKHSRLALEIDPENTGALKNLADSLNEQGRYEEAFEHYRSAMEADPGDANVPQNMAESLRKRGMNEEALKWYRHAIAKNSGNPLSHAGMGHALYTMKRYEEAVSSIGQALALEPDMAQAPRLHFILGRMAQETNRPEEAGKHYENSLRTDPGFRDAADYLAALRFNQERYEEALSLYRTIARADPANALNYSNIGAVLFKMGRTQEALSNLERALSLDPDLQTALRNRELILDGMRRDGR